LNKNKKKWYRSLNKYFFILIIIININRNIYKLTHVNY
jgi:hypothetical protein